jgi:hypothetical protein
MTYFETLIYAAAKARREDNPVVREISEKIFRLYEERSKGKPVFMALQDPFFPLSLYVKEHLKRLTPSKPGLMRAARDLFLLSRMFLRIRRDIDRYFDNRTVTCVDLNGGALQEIHGEQWCSLCGECCHLSGTVPDPQNSTRYPGYWYAYIAGDGPLLQRFCPFLFELPPRRVFFCAIQRVKPRTCLAYGRGECEKNHPGRARGSPIE